MKILNDCLKLFASGTPIIGLEYYCAERQQLLFEFEKFAQVKGLSVYYWNSGFTTIQCVNFSEQCILESTELAVTDDILKFLLEKEEPGIFLLEDILGAEKHLLDNRCISQISNAFFQMRWRNIEQYWVLLSDYIQLPTQLQPLIPVFKYPLPDCSEVAALVDKFCDRSPSLDYSRDRITAKNQLVRACQGLPTAEINWVLERSLNRTSSLEQIASLVLEHKVFQLKNQGLEFIAKPDVPIAGGLDLLNAYLNDVVKLLEPEARKYNLRPPKGMLLWGPPGTGKSLSAKLTAQKLGYALLAMSWGNVLGSANPDRALAKILETAEHLGGCVLFADDFDKGFAGWDSNADGGVARRLSQKLLTWMQEHVADVLMIATVNRLEMLPPELIRRFDDGGIWFVDLPDNGARYEIFNLHLAQYFPQQFGEGQQNPWSDRQWYSLLSDYAGATPAEIGNAVKRCAERAYCQGTPGKIELADLRYQRTQFVLSSQRSSEEIQAIRNQASFARPASGSDRSKFAVTEQELFEYKAPIYDPVQ
ncbi:MAG: AAA family ATPase [Desertifilum sp. SIO1I2]|nr:AAA family ATPase [Desertifilum sp. SIO1I2]